MPTFTTPEEFAEVQIAVGGRAYAFAEGELTVEQEADARRVRLFATENPHLGIAEDGETVDLSQEDEPAGEGDADPAATEDPAADPSDPNDDGSDEPADDETGSAGEDAPSDTGDATDGVDEAADAAETRR